MMATGSREYQFQNDKEVQMYQSRPPPTEVVSQLLPGWRGVMILPMNPRLCSVLIVTLLSFAAAQGVEITATAPGSPLRKTILDDLRAAEPTASTQKEKKQKIVFDKVVLRVAGDWVWFSVAPRTED